MLCRILLIAAGASLVVLSGAAAQTCTNDKFLCEPSGTGAEKPVLFVEYFDRIFNRKPAPAPAAPDDVAAKQDEPQRAAQPHKRRPIAKPAAATPPAEARKVEDLPADTTEVVPVVVKTTREPAQAAPPVLAISPEEWNEIDRLAAALTTPSTPSTPPATSTVGSGEAERAYAMAETPPPQPSNSGAMLELAVMIFGGALAAISALRIFTA